MTRPHSAGRPIEILLVEDDPGDTLITTEALQHSKVINNLHTVVNGEEALAFPRRDGREVLAEVKADDDLRRIPIVVLTTSAAEEDIVRSYDLHANAYVTKPVDFDRFVHVVKSIDEFYFTIVRLPTN
jgi:CheY-like chemotaxis protein